MSSIEASMGLHKLTEYLNQTRKQAEMAIDNLNAQVRDLNREKREVLHVAERLESERDYYRNLAEQLKNENAKKNKFKERDDWKSLLESAQRDRIQLIGALKEAKDQVSSLEREVGRLRESNNSDSSIRNMMSSIVTIDDEERGRSSSNHRSYSSSSSNNDNNEYNNNNNNNEDGRSTGASTSGTNGSPRSMNLSLKQELDEVHKQVEKEREKTERERIYNKRIIEKLNRELEAARLVNQMGNNDTSLDARTQAGAINSMQLVKQRDAMGIFSIFSFFFGGSSNKSHILRV